MTKPKDEEAVARGRYATDLSDRQWGLIEPMIPPAKPGGRPRSVVMREVVNGILYLLRTGCAWRLLPHDLPPWGTVHYYYRRFRRDGTWERVHDALRERVRAAAGREPTPSAAVLDSQAVKTTDTAPAATTGYDAGKKVKGRKRHVAVDTLGLILVLVVTAAGVQDRDGGLRVLRAMAGWFPRLKVIFADSAYGTGRLAVWAAALGGWAMSIVRKDPGQKGFKVQPRRWVVERTFAWLNKYRRLSKDYEAAPASSEAMIRLAMINLMSRRLSAARI